jgi:hypothetical protein
MIAVVALAVLPVTGALAQEDPVEAALEVCQPEIESFCSQVTPGDGRLLACFIAHEDKISGQCGWAVYRAMDALETFMDAVTYVAESCWDDIIEHCAEVEMGEGRIATCLLESQEKVTPACQQAMKDVELEVVEE